VDFQLPIRWIADRQIPIVDFEEKFEGWGCAKIGNRQSKMGND
jgi:hypothetical protein